MMKYTKADLERIVFTQLENLNAMNDLLSIMKVQNELIKNANKKGSHSIYLVEKDKFEPIGQVIDNLLLFL